MSIVFDQLEPRKVSGTMSDAKLSSALLAFIRNNVLSITELTRTNKLAEILDSFANTKSEQIFIVQNSRNRNAQGALVDVELLQELLMIREAVEHAADRKTERMTAERLDTFEPNIPLAEALHKHSMDIDVDEIMKLSEEVELE